MTAPDLPIIDSPAPEFMVEMQTDGFGLRFALESTGITSWAHIYSVCEYDLKPEHIETNENGNCNVYRLAMIECDEVIRKMRLFIHAYDVIREGRNG